jgi:hypothetical protein
LDWQQLALGAGLLLACWGASLFFNTNNNRLDVLTAKVEELVQRPDRTDEVVAKLDDLRREAGKMGGITARLASIEESLGGLKNRSFIRGNPDEHGTAVNGNVITTAVSVFKWVPHDSGSWKYPNGASANQPPLQQYCAWLGNMSSGTSIRIDLARNGVRLANIAVGVPRLEDALQKCVWWNGSTN